MNTEIAGQSDTGRRRSENQDTIWFSPSGDTDAVAALLVVADGIGGAAAGEVASSEAVAEFTRAFASRTSDQRVEDFLRGATARANRYVFDKGQAEGRYRGMGSTLVAAIIDRDHMWVANVGDSRCYRIRAGMAEQVTQDHSWAAEQVRAGLAAEGDDLTQTTSHIITRSLGGGPEVEVDLIDAGPVEVGDGVLLCSDGLSDVVRDDEIGEIASRYVPAEAAGQLINLANERGGPDNISVVIARAGAASPSPTASPSPPGDTAAAPPPPALGEAGGSGKPPGETIVSSSGPGGGARVSLGTAGTVALVVIAALVIGLIVGLVCASSGDDDDPAPDGAATATQPAPGTTLAGGETPGDDVPDEDAAPPEGEPGTCADGSPAAVHTVASGDSLLGIALESGVSVEDIIGCDGDIAGEDAILQIDQPVLVPTGGTEP